jgi:hypothetical protein
MKKNVLKFGLFSMVVLGMTSCKNEENEAVDKKIADLEHYVDSLKLVSSADVESNWDKIAVDFESKSSEFNGALMTMKEEDKAKFQEKMDAVAIKYDELKTSIESKVIITEAKPSQSQMLRDRLFGAGKIGEDMSFAWVNKDNILKTYETFFQAYKDNKGDFTREDYDEIKLMYEALDSRKNTVEKEGLTAEDNNAIAAIKLKFGPMFKLNRIGAKSREAEEAKE